MWPHCFLSDYRRRPCRHGPPDGRVHQYHREPCFLDDLSARQCHIRKRGRTLHRCFFPARRALRLVTASITGSILLNVLLLIGLAMLAGGLKFKEQKFNKDSAGLSSTMLFVAVVGLGLPSMYKMMVGTPSHEMTLAVSIILGIVYILSLIYTLVTHRHMFCSRKTGSRRKP